MLPTLYWMLSCTGCGCRFVVHDTYLVCDPPGSDDDRSPGAGYSGLPVFMRHACVRGCASGLEAVGSLFNADDEKMWLHDPYIPVPLSPPLRDEWRYLIEQPGRSVDTVFPRVAILEDHANRRPVLSMTDHAGRCLPAPEYWDARRCIDDMEPGQTLLLTRRNGGTFEIQRNDDTFRARLLDGAGGRVDAAQLDRAVVEKAMLCYLRDTDVAGTRWELEPPSPLMQRLRELEARARGKRPR